MRERYFDTLKGVAVFIVYVTHFIASFHPKYFDLWQEMPTCLILKGISGKLGVCILGVVLGYFSYRKGISKNESIASYCLKRWLYFLICAFAINSIYSVNAYLHGEDIASIVDFIRITILLGNDIFPTFWCMPYFLVASFIAFFLGYYECNAKEALVVIIALLYLGNMWVAICLFGVIAFLLSKVSLSVKGQIIAAIGTFVLIKRDENNLTFVIDGIVVVLIIWIIANNKIIKDILSNRVFSFAGKNSMGIFLIHPILYSVIGPIFLRITSLLKYGHGFLLSMLLSWAVVLLVGYLLNEILLLIYKQMCQVACKISFACHSAKIGIKRF